MRKTSSSQAIHWKTARSFKKYIFVIYTYAVVYAPFGIARN